MEWAHWGPSAAYRACSLWKVFAKDSCLSFHYKTGFFEPTRCLWFWLKLPSESTKNKRKGIQFGEWHKESTFCIPCLGRGNEYTPYTVYHWWGMWTKGRNLSHLLVPMNFQMFLKTLLCNWYTIRLHLKNHCLQMPQ